MSSYVIRFYENVTLLYFHKNRIIQNTKEKYIGLKYEILTVYNFYAISIDIQK